MPLFRFALEDELKQEVEVDDVALAGNFVITKKGNVTEIIPGDRLTFAQIVEVADEPS